MSLIRLTAPLAALLLAAGLAGAQDPTLVLEKDVLELENQSPPGASALYANAYFSPYENLDQRLIAALRLARPGSTVYMSYYSISYQAYPEVFRELKDKGVTVRLNLYEKEAVADGKRIDDDLIADGFDVALIPNLRSPKGQGSMHTKFTVINDELIVTGSANLSASASLANHEHIIVLKNSALARRYKSEWSEQRRAKAAMAKAMTADEWDTFNSSYSDPFPSDWTSAGRADALKLELERIDRRSRNTHRRVQGWFSPEDQLEERCREQIRQAQKTVHVAMYTFVNGLVNDLVDAARRGVQVVVIADDHQQDMSWASWVNDKLEGEPNIRYIRAENDLGLYSSLHHKYAVIDGEVVLGGSYNWTANATLYNDENLLVLRGQKLAGRFEADFAGMLAEYDPQGPGISVQIPGATTPVLFAAALSFDVPRNLRVELVVTGDAGFSQRIELRHSRSTGENWLGSAVLPRGENLHWRLQIGDQAGFVGILNGTGGGKLHQEPENAHSLEVNGTGAAQIVRGRWSAPTPSFD